MAASNILNDKAIRAALKRSTSVGKPETINDGDGLSLICRPDGGGWWRLRYYMAGQENRLSEGTYPEVTLSDARKRRDADRALIARGIDPSAERKAGKAANKATDETQRMIAAGEPLPGTFEAVARRWHAMRTAEWAPSYANKVIARLEGKVFPYIGARPVASIEPPELLVILRRCEDSGIIETAHRVRDTCSEVFRFAVAEGLVRSDPARDLAGALRKHTTRHIPSITDPQRYGELLRAIASYRGTPTVKVCLTLAALVFLRPGEELRCAGWNEFDLDAGTWLVPANRMKRTKDGKANGPDHLVPLSRQAVDALREIHPITGTSPLVFRGERHRNKPISNNTLNAALTALGFSGDEHRAHGFRASARTMLAERLGVAPEVIEAQLAHSVTDPLGRAYNRTQFHDQRRAMMQNWADYLDTLRNGGQVVQLKAA